MYMVLTFIVSLNNISFLTYILCVPLSNSRQSLSQNTILQGGHIYDPNSEQMTNWRKWKLEAKY
jgi:hypothetical protein